MPDLEEMTPGQILADTNVATFIESLALGIARAQRELDRNSLETAVAIASERPEFSDRSLLELGFSPTFYHFQYADVEVSLQITMRVERSTSVSVGLSADFSHSTSSTAQGTGTATITVRTGGSSPATARIRLSQAGPGSVTTGATRVELVNGAGTTPQQVSIVANSLRRTANALADRMGQTTPTDAVPEVLRAQVQLVAGGTPIQATTDNTGTYTVTTPNRIEINARPALGARAWVTVTAAGSVTLIGSDTATWPAVPNPETAATSAIDALSGYTAVLLFRAGKSVSNPHFVFNKSDELEPSTEVDRIVAWAEFLKARPTMNVKVVGYTDQSGTDGYNQTLSLARANHVLNFLREQGVAAGQLAAEGRGETNPVENAPGQQRLVNRRVELELVGATQNVVLVQSVSTGNAVIWGASRPSFSAGAGEVLAQDDGKDAVAFGTSYVEVSGHSFYTSLPASPRTPNTVFVPGPTPESAAAALADSILASANVDAYASGRVVLLLPVGSHAILTLESTARSAAANSLALAADGSLSREAGFSGAADSGEVNNGDTVTLGATTLTARTTTPVGANEFARGADASATAGNLAAAVSAVSGFSGAASGDRVTVTGPLNTALGTSNAAAFVLSGTRLVGQQNVPREERNTAVAVGLNVEVGYQRRFGLEVTGNSRIAARLVSIPAPVELLDEIRTFLSGNNP